MTKGKGAYSDYELIRAAQETLREAESEYRVKTQVTIVSTEEVGRLTVTIAARRADQSPLEKPLARVTTTWPGAREMSFPAALYQSSVSLYRILDDSSKGIIAGS